MIRSRQNNCKVPISIREWLVCIFAILTLVFTAWSFGGYENWALHLLFLGGLATFLASVFPMPSSWNGFDKQHGNLKNFKRLLAQPFFWASLCFLGYIIIQYLNPALVQVFGDQSWWVEPMIPPLGSYLPSSVKADYDTMDSLRAFVIQVSAFSLACGILVGIKRRKTVLIILWSFVISGVAMSFVAILQKLSGTEKILWLINCANPNLWGTFSYRNQGVAYLILVATIVGALYFFYIKQKSIKHEKSGIHLLCILFIFMLFASVWLALSRSGIILGSAWIIFFIIVSLFDFFKRGIIHSLLVSGSIVSLIILISFLFVGNFTDWEGLDKKYNALKVDISKIESNGRVLSTIATWDMANDRLKFGWGAGSFRYIFPLYQHNYDELWYIRNYYKRGWGGRRVYDYAHNDWAQYLAEYGIVGSVILAFLFSALLNGLFKLRNANICATILLLLSICLIFLHNLVDFIFSSPSYWIAFWGSIFSIIKLFNLKNKTIEQRD